MKKYLFIIAFILISIFGCDGKKLINSKDAGELISSTLIPTSFNESIKSVVTTTKGTFAVKGAVSEFKGTKTILKIYTFDKRELCFENNCYTIVRAKQ